MNAGSREGRSMSNIDPELQTVAWANGAIILMRADFDALVEALRKARSAFDAIVRNDSATRSAMREFAAEQRLATDAALAKVAP